MTADDTPSEHGRAGAVLHGSSEALVPFPAEWKGERPRTPTWVVVFCVVLVAASLLLLPLALKDRDVRGIGLCLSVGGLFGLMGVVSVADRRWPGRRRAAVRATSRGLCFPYRALLWRALVGATVSGLPATGFLLWVAFTDDDVSRRGREMMLIGPVLLVYLVITAWNLATGRLRRGYVLLDEVGVRHRSWGASCTMPWDVVRSVHVRHIPVKGAFPEIVVEHREGLRATFERRARWIGVKAPRSLPDLVVRATDVDGDAALLAHAAAYYFEHPDHRVELGDERALRRVLEGRAVVQDLGPGW